MEAIHKCASIVNNCFASTEKLWVIMKCLINHFLSILRMEKNL